MYNNFFHLNQAPFSIAPDPRYLFMSERHREALAHLLYGVGSGGGFVVLTGEIGAGKTTICRCLLEQVPENCKVAYIFNPKLSVVELLQSVCQEFRIDPALYAGQAGSVKTYVDVLNVFLLEAHAAGRNSVLIIDEAQNLSADVLEQLRLLTNLETNARKLLQIILIGQPELRSMLAQPELEQLAQRMIARYHLDALSQAETAIYIGHRLSVAGLTGSNPFSRASLKLVHRLTHGIPRRINLLCDRAMLGAYSRNLSRIEPVIVSQAAREIFGKNHAAARSAPRKFTTRWSLVALAALLGIGAGTLSAAAYLKSTAVRQPPAREALLVSASMTQANPASDSGAAALVDLAKAFSSMSQNESQAFRDLMPLWGLTIAGTEPCIVAAASGLQCYRGSGGFSELQVLGRPALVTLYDAAGLQYFALLTGLTANAATLKIGDATYTVSPLALARHFRGGFATLWRAPPAFNEKIGPGDRGAAVDWLAGRLASLNGEAARAANLPYDAELARMVREFQAAQGLRPDSVAGPKTLMLVNRAAGIEEPRLAGTSDGYGK